MKPQSVCLVAAVCSVLALSAGAAETSTNAVGEVSQKTQCWSVTKSGNRCKRNAAPSSRYCRQHSSSAPANSRDGRCQSMTAGGARCAASAIPGKRYCPKHTDAKTTGSAPP